MSYLAALGIVVIILLSSSKLNYLLGILSPSELTSALPI
jgi:hypothetical protein